MERPARSAAPQPLVPRVQSEAPLKAVDNIVNAITSEQEPCDCGPPCDCPRPCHCPPRAPAKIEAKVKSEVKANVKPVTVERTHDVHVSPVSRRHVGLTVEEHPRASVKMGSWGRPASNQFRTRLSAVQPPSRRTSVVTPVTPLGRSFPGAVTSVTDPDVVYSAVAPDSWFVQPMQLEPIQTSQYQPSFSMPATNMTPSFGYGFGGGGYSSGPMFGGCAGGSCAGGSCR